MRKNLLPLIISLLLCGGTTAAIMVTNARAQGTRKPVMVALVSPGMQIAANTPQSHDEMPRRGMHMPPPADMAAHRKEMCRDFFAHQAGMLSYTEAKLDLTPTQQPLFDRWKSVKLGIAKQRESACDARPTRHAADARRPSLVDRIVRNEEWLKQRLTNLDSERPALEAFYNALSPRQKMEFGLGERPHGMPGLMRQRMFSDAMGPHDPMGLRMGTHPAPQPDAPAPEH